MFEDRVLSGMRPTGAMHLGHYHGALKNWVRLQNEYPCLFFAADWHALTTHYEDPSVIEQSVWDMFIDWLACGIDQSVAAMMTCDAAPPAPYAAVRPRSGRSSSASARQPVPQA